MPFITITEQNAAVYRDLLGSEVVLEDHSSVEGGEEPARLGGENLGFTVRGDHNCATVRFDVRT